jgi:site-specific DNA-methyltransferase (adenine-specific)
MIEINKVYNENCLDTMSRMPDGFIDLTVTSPPYDNLRAYNGYSFDFEAVAKELFRVTKKGGVVVWVVGDATIKGSETGTSFRQALYFKEIGFNLHDTMIWCKDSTAFPSSNRYFQATEYMFILSKGRPGKFNRIKDRKNKYAGATIHGTSRGKNGKTKRKTNSGTVREYGSRFNYWIQPTEKQSKNYGHPAMFPEKLARDHIISWSNKGDLVYDPFMGSGTTAKMAILEERNFIGSEVSEEYCKIIEERINIGYRELEEKFSRS